MVAAKIDLTGENAAEIGANYEISITLSGVDDLLEYQGICQVKSAIDSTEIIISPTVEILNKDSFRLLVNYDAYPTTLIAGNYFYDVLFYKISKRFYAIEGKIQIIKRVTKLL
jgi:hypothetical protein